MIYNPFVIVKSSVRYYQAGCPQKVLYAPYHSIYYRWNAWDVSIVMKRWRQMGYLTAETQDTKYLSVKNAVLRKKDA